MRKVKVSAEGRNRLLQLQNGGCAICKKSPVDGVQFHLDHSHSEGHIRGYLCSNCNHGLGVFQDSPALLLDAAKYLEEAS